MWEGGLTCDDCFDTECKTCSGEGEVEVSEIDMGTQKFPLADTECSCCGARSRDDGSPNDPYPWFVVKAQLVDEDGIYFYYLCAGSTTDAPEDGCLHNILEQTPQPAAKDKLDTLKPLLEEDDDGLASSME
jgi:hypothetical protein